MAPENFLFQKHRNFLKSDVICEPPLLNNDKIIRNIKINIEFHKVDNLYVIKLFAKHSFQSFKKIKFKFRLNLFESDL